jgi:hypothetical protein
MDRSLTEGVGQMTPFEWISASIALVSLMLQFVQWKKDHPAKNNPK